MAPVTTPLYAAFEGLLLGGLSLVFEARYPGIVINAVGLTLGTLAVLLLAYSSGLIRPSENFKLGVVAATGRAAATQRPVADGVSGGRDIKTHTVHGKIRAL